MSAVPGAMNGSYDNSGNRLGYGVSRDHGSGVNLFDNDGNRIGYQNKRGRVKVAVGGKLERVAFSPRPSRCLSDRS